MKQIDEHRFQADENKIFMHNATLVRMGNRIYISSDDSIANYAEVPMTDEEIRASMEKTTAHNTVDKKRLKVGKIPHQRGRK